MTTTFSKNIREQVAEFVRNEKEKNPSADSSEILQLLMNEFEAVSGRRRTVISQENMCMARTWSGGKGGQCHKVKISGSDYCKACAKKASECSIPASFNTDGSHKGLFWGRVDKELPMKSADGKGLAIMWRTEFGIKKARSLLESGECPGWHPFCTQRQFRTGDWDKELNTTLPRVKGSGKKPTKTKSKRVQTAKQRWMAENRTDIQNMIETLAIKTKKSPKCLVAFLIDADFNPEEAYNSLQDTMKDNDKWAEYIEDNGPFKNEKFDVEEDGSFTGELSGAKRSQLLLGPVSKICTAMWKKLSDEVKAPFISAYEEEKTKDENELNDSANTSQETNTSEQSTDTTDDEEEDDEECEEINVDTIENAIYKGNTMTIYVDQDNIAYDEDSNELGTYNKETNTVE